MSKNGTVFSRVFLLSVGLSVSTLCSLIAAETALLFQAGQSASETFRHRNAPWVEGDIKPAVQLQEFEGKPWLFFSYSGSSGLAQSLLRCEKALETVTFAVEGASLLIHCRQNDYPKIEIGALSVDGVHFNHRMTLKEGTHRYNITGKTGKKQGELQPFNWNRLSSLSILARNNGKQANPAFLLRKISLLPKNTETAMQGVELTLLRKRKFLEIFPLEGSVQLDGRLDDSAWQNAVRTTNFHYYKGGGSAEQSSPLQLWLAYDQEYLYLASQSEFPTSPIAAVDRRDGDVWQDEAIEYFFGMQNYNRTLLQFSINAKDIIFDYRYRFHADTGGFRMHKEDSISQETASSYQSPLFCREIRFPWSELGMHPGQSRILPFQFAQNYTLDRPDKRLQTLCWAETQAFPNAVNFGFLILNQKPFGSGELEFHKASKIRESNGRIQLQAELSLRDFPAGEYQLRQIAYDPEKRSVEQVRKLDLDRKEHRITLIFSDLVDSNGIYSVLLSIMNSGGDQKLIAVNLQNNMLPTNLFGQHALNPQAKKVRWGKEIFSLPQAEKLFLPENATERSKLTAELFQKKYRNAFGVALQMEKSTPDNASAPGIHLAISPKFTGQEGIVELPAEGSALQVTEGLVRVIGGDEAGLYYGTVTLFQAAQNSALNDKRLVLRECEIIDWPDTPIRIVAMNHPHQLWPDKRPAENHGIEYLMDWVERFVAEQKSNLLMLDISGNVTGKRRPEFRGASKIYTLQDLGRLAEFCRQRFIEVCPQWECGGHANWWLLQHHPELREKGYSEQADVTHPDHNPIVFDCMQDVIEVIKPKYLSPKSDEWWHRRKAGETPDPLLRGKTRAEAFLDFHLQLHAWLQKQGIRMMIFEDMLSPFHNGKKENTCEIVDQLPKDIIIMWWKGGHYLDDGLPWILNKGFTVWCTCTGFYTLPEQLNRHPAIQGFGKGLYDFNNWLWKDSSNHYYYIPFTLFRAADYAWNRHSDKRQSVEEFIELGRGCQLGCINATKLFPGLENSFLPLVMDDAANASLNELLAHWQLPPPAFPADVQYIANVPTQLVSRQKNDCILLKKGTMLKVNSKAASLIFLHTAWLDWERIKQNKIKLPSKRDWPYGYPFGQYRICYQDGSSVDAGIRSGVNILPFSHGTLFRYGNDIRYYYFLPLEKQKVLPCFQWEWINPYPDKTITGVMALRDNVIPDEALQTVWLALSLRLHAVN